MSPMFPELLDMVERSRLFAAIEQAAARLGIGVFVVRVDVTPPRLLFASEGLAILLGRPAAEILGSAPWEFLTPEKQRAMRELLASRGPDAPPIAVETEVARPDGTHRPVECGVARISTDGVVLTVGYVRDVTTERQTIGALARSEARFRSMIENAPDGVVIVRAGAIAHANPIGARLLGAPDADSVVGQPLASFLPPADAARAAERIGRVMRGEHVGPSEYRVLAETDRVVEIKSIQCEWDGGPALLAFARDITERKRLERELVRADRLATIGTMAAAVAHEINNPLTYVQLSLQRLERELRGVGGDRAAAMVDHVKNALHGTERVATIVRDLRTFARDDGEGPVRPVDLAIVADRALKMVEHDLKHHAKLVRRYAAVPTVLGSSSRLEQVVLNLVINAIHSMPEGDPERDEIAVELATAGDAVILTVRDTGVGIAPEDRDRVFEPFFTTKPAGEGTGLGLAVCKRIVEAMGGSISIESEVGAGTAVTVRFAAGAGARTITAPPPLAPPTGERLRVLVVDDEPLVRRVIRLSLAERHDVTDVGDGHAALAALAASGADVILCDLMMPGMTGRDLHDRVRDLYPGLERRIVFVTGGAFQPRLAEWMATIQNPRLIKPFTEDQIVSIIDDVMRDN